jgi:integrase
MSVHIVKSSKKTTYQSRWTDSEGKRRAKNFGTKTEALRFAQEMSSSVRRGEYSDPKAGKTKLKVVYEDWKKGNLGLKPKTIASYDSLWKCMVEPAWGNRSISGITRSAVKAWVSESKSITGKVISPSRMKQAYVLLKLLLDHAALDMNLIGRNPVQSGGRSGKNFLPRTQVQKQKRALEKEELLALASSAGEYRLLILVAGLLGIRWAELIALTPEDFDFRNKLISVSKSLSEVNGRFVLVTPKSGKVRVLPLLSVLEKDLKALCLATPEGETVFRSVKGENLRHSNFMRRIFAPALAASGVPQITFHQLRDTAISQAIASGADVLVLSKIAGHSNPSITLNVYGHLLKDSMGSIQRALDESYADMNPGEPSDSRHMPSAS